MTDIDLLLDSIWLQIYYATYIYMYINVYIYVYMQLSEKCCMRHYFSLFLTIYIIRVNGHTDRDR